MPNHSETAEAIERIKEEIATLKREQDEAFKLSVYLPMSRKEMQQDDERREKIKTLLRELSQLIERLQQVTNSQ